jgi:DNA-binding response OmpR family regulator
MRAVGDTRRVTVAPAGDGGTVLVVDDEAVLAGVVSTYLERAGYAVTVTGNGLEAVRLARSLRPDVVVLDLGLPGLDGIAVCREIRTFSDCYVVMLTARADEVDTLVGLSVGADDYVTKPFSVRELVARVQALLRRPRAGAPLGRGMATATGGGAAGPGGGPAPAAEEPARVFGDLVLDPAAREVTVVGRPVELTRTEFDVLEALSARPRLAFTRRQLVDAVWGEAWVGDEHLVDVHIGHVRRKLGDDPAAPRYIRTVRGVGYRMGDGR